MTRDSRAASEGLNILHLLFTLLAGLCFLGGVGVLLYEVWGLLTGDGWQQVKAIVALYPIFGSRPPGEPTLLWQAVALAAMLPLDLSLMALGWIFSRIANGFEKLS
jgi:hypothetical protein